MASVFRATVLGVNNSRLQGENKCPHSGFFFPSLRNSFYSLWKCQTQNHMLLLHCRGLSAHLVEKNGIFILTHKGTCLLKMGLRCDGKGLSQSLTGWSGPIFFMLLILFILGMFSVFILQNLEETYSSIYCLASHRSSYPVPELNYISRVSTLPWQHS